MVHPVPEEKEGSMRTCRLFVGVLLRATGLDCTYCELGIFESQRFGALDYPKETIAHMPGWKRLKTEILSS